MLNHIYANYNRFFTGFNHPWLSRVALQSYANIIHDKGAALDFCWGFVDGTVRPVCRPNQNQRILYNGHQRVLSNGVLSNFKVWLFQNPKTPKPQNPNYEQTIERYILNFI